MTIGVVVRVCSQFELELLKPPISPPTSYVRRSRELNSRPLVANESGVLRVSELTLVTKRSDFCELHVDYAVALASATKVNK